MNEIINVVDVLKDSFLTNFRSNISISLVLLTLGVSLLFSFYLYFSYLLTSKNTIYSKSFNITMSLMNLITSALILSMQSNIVLSLGMVGALSIVRFRTAIKEPRDLLFLFWSISTGIIVGGSLYSLAFCLAVLMTIAFLILDRLPGNKAPYLLIVNCRNVEAEKTINNILKQLKMKYHIRSRNSTVGRIDLVYEFNTKDETELFKRLNDIPDIIGFNLLSHDGETQL